MMRIDDEEDDDAGDDDGGDVDEDGGDGGKKNDDTNQCDAWDDKDGDGVDDRIKATTQRRW